MKDTGKYLRCLFSSQVFQQHLQTVESTQCLITASFNSLLATSAGFLLSGIRSALDEAVNLHLRSESGVKTHL